LPGSCHRIVQFCWNGVTCTIAALSSGMFSILAPLSPAGDVQGRLSVGRD
jgi:hypothetical protein